MSFLLHSCPIGPQASQNKGQAWPSHEIFHEIISVINRKSYPGSLHVISCTSVAMRQLRLLSGCGCNLFILILSFETQGFSQNETINRRFICVSGIRKNPAAPFVPRTVIIGGKVDGATRCRLCVCEMIVDRKPSVVTPCRPLLGITWPR